MIKNGQIFISLLHKAKLHISCCYFSQSRANLWFSNHEKKLSSAKFCAFFWFSPKNCKNLPKLLFFSHSISMFLHLRNHILSHDSCRSLILQPHFSKLDVIKSKSIPSVICISLHVKVHHFSCRQDFPQAVYLNLL